MICFRQWRSWIRPLIFTVYLVVVVVALPLFIIEFQVTGTTIHLQAWFIAGFFVILTIPISIWSIVCHLIHYTRPDLQRHIVRILWMVPIYSGNAWFALRFTGATIYLDTIRECYEAYVIYNFMAYLLNFLHSEYVDLEMTLEDKPQSKHLIPFCCFPPWKMGKPFIMNCKHGVLQYTVIRPLTTIIALICHLCGKYGEGEFGFTSAWSYLVIINNISQIWAMYCLILFYTGTKEELAPIRPVAKFLCVKAVVFMSFWQAVLIAALVQFDVIKADATSEFYLSIKDVANGLQDFVICVEMFLASLAHYYSFSHKPFVDYAASNGNCCSSFLSMWDVSDVRDDVVEHVRHVGNTVTRPLRNPVRRPVENERTPLLGNTSDSGEEGGGVERPATPPIHITADDLLTVAVHPEEARLATLAPALGGGVGLGRAAGVGGAGGGAMLAEPLGQRARRSTGDDGTSVHTMGSSVDLSIGGADGDGSRRSLTSSMNNYLRLESTEVSELEEEGEGDKEEGGPEADLDFAKDHAAKDGQASSVVATAMLVDLHLPPPTEVAPHLGPSLGDALQSRDGGTAGCIEVGGPLEGASGVSGGGPTTTVLDDPAPKAVDTPGDSSHGKALATPTVTGPDVRIPETAPLGMELPGSSDRQRVDSDSDLAFPENPESARRGHQMSSSPSATPPGDQTTDSLNSSSASLDSTGLGTPIQPSNMPGAMSKGSQGMDSPSSVHDTSSRDTSHDVSRDVSRDVSQDTSRDVSQDTSRDVSYDTSRNVSHDTSGKARDISHDTSEDTSRDTSRDESRDSSHETSHDKSRDTSRDTSSDTSHEASHDKSHDTSHEASHDKSRDTSHDKSRDTSHDESRDKSHDMSNN